VAEEYERAKLVKKEIDALGEEKEEKKKKKKKKKP